MFTTTGLIILIAYAFICGLFSAYVASKKGYDSVLWFIFGLLFNFVALIAIAGLPIVTDTLTSDVIYTKKEYEKLKEVLKDDKKNNLTDEERREKEIKKLYEKLKEVLKDDKKNNKLTDEERKEKEKELEIMKNILGY